MPKCPDCQAVMPFGLKLCGDCREKAQRAEREFSQAVEERFALLDHLLANYALFEQWLVDHDK